MVDNISQAPLQIEPLGWPLYPYVGAVAKEKRIKRLKASMKPAQAV
jgi:hypothetical protein